MSHEYGINWEEQYGTNAFAFGTVIADIAALVAKTPEDTDFWVNNVNGKATLSMERTDKTYAKGIVRFTDSEELTAEELEELNTGNLPIVKIAMPEGLFELYYPIAYKYNMPLTGRQFHDTSAHCYTLILDYYEQEHGIVLPKLFVPSNYIAQLQSHAKSNLFLEGWEQSGFKQVLIPKPGDLLYMRVGASNEGPNHCGVYYDDNVILHHFHNRLSCKQRYKGIWKDTTVMVMRHKELA